MLAYCVPVKCFSVRGGEPGGPVAGPWLLSTVGSTRSTSSRNALDLDRRLRVRRNPDGLDSPTVHRQPRFALRIFPTRDVWQDNASSCSHGSSGVCSAGEPGSHPFWLGEDLAVSLDLEASYNETCQVLRLCRMPHRVVGPCENRAQVSPVPWFYWPRSPTLVVGSSQASWPRKRGSRCTDPPPTSGRGSNA
jgi:hypothetical protein